VLTQPQNKSHKKAILAVVTILIVVGAVLFAVVNMGLLNFNPSANPSGTSNTQTDRISLVNYALELINTDRQANGLQNVTLRDRKSVV
jgi:flagellar basal body-associated protein FliL